MTTSSESDAAYFFSSNLGFPREVVQARSKITHHELSCLDRRALITIVRGVTTTTCSPAQVCDSSAAPAQCCVLCYECLGRSWHLNSFSRAAAFCSARSVCIDSVEQIGMYWNDRGGLYSRWVDECIDAVGSLRARTKQAKAYQSHCWEMHAAALSIAKTLEQVIYTSHLSSELLKDLPELFAAAVSTIELAQSLIEVTSISSTTECQLLHFVCDQYAMKQVPCTGLCQSATNHNLLLLTLEPGNSEQISTCD